jgi:hypothetical protein
MSHAERPAAGTLSAQDLLAGGAVTHDVSIPEAVVRPGAGASGAAGRVRLRPLSVGTLALISRASRDDASLIPLLMIKEAMVEPALGLDQIRHMHVGLVHYLVERINLISGLTAEGGVVDEAVASPLGRAHLLLAKHFGWSPEQVAQLTPAQVSVYLAGIDRLLEWSAAREAAP